ncbi:DUF2490 domain-containing protein [Zunongwangia sp.]|uniref:DUF2490 domain-containing protein n=1 Tax=Zunongwangia sp. TaxID=1965325 RepID=UPI003AA83FDD
MIFDYSKHLLFLLICLLSFHLQAQNNFSAVINPNVSLSIKTETRWSYNFSVQNRDIVYKNEDWDFAAKHLQFSHFTSYKTSLSSKLSLGILYRFKEFLDTNNHDEVRITEQYAYYRKYNLLKTAHRIRFEQRIRDITFYRWRYRFSLEFPLNKSQIENKGFFIGTSTELLYTISKKTSPIPGNRFSISIGKALKPCSKIKVGLQYRYEDYLKKVDSQLFFISSLSITI